MKITLTPDMLAALEAATDRPDWLTERIGQIRAGGEPYVLALATEESTAVEELCAMNIRFDESGNVRDEHQPLEDLSLRIMEQY
jgi:hypothetical protein